MNFTGYRGHVLSNKCTCSGNGRSKKLFFSQNFIYTSTLQLLTMHYTFHGQIAPVAVSDAAMLAPEEVFDGKGDVKEEAELTQAERKRRRANKKRKFKGMIGQTKEVSG